MRRRWWAGGLVLWASVAGAHPEFAATGTNRYLKLSLLGGGALRVAYTVMIGDVPSLEARRAADKNGDGHLDASEQRAAADALQAAVDQGLTVEVDGTRRKIAWEPPVPGFSADDRVQPVPFSIDLVGRVDVGRGDHRVRVDDATPAPQLEETEIRVEEGPHTRLVAGWQGREDAGRQTRFVFRGPKFSLLEDRSIGFRYVDNGGAPRRRPLPIALVGVLLGGVAGMVLLGRARRRARRRDDATAG